MKRGNNKRFLKGFIFTLKGNEIQNVGITPEYKSSATANESTSFVLKCWYNSRF